MRKTLTTVALLLALSCTAFGGEMSTPPAPAPPQPVSAEPEPTDAAQEITAEGVMGNDAPGSLTQAVFELLTVLPSLL